MCGEITKVNERGVVSSSFIDGKKVQYNFMTEKEVVGQLQIILISDINVLSQTIL